MADFLNRLAARALGAIPLAEPVIPALFSAGAEPAASFASAIEPTPPSREITEEPASPLEHPAAEAYPRSETRANHPAPPYQNLHQASHLMSSQPSRAFHPQDPQPPDAELEISPAMPLERMTQTLNAVSETTAHRPQATSHTPFAEPKPFPRLAPLAEPTRNPVPQHPDRPSATRLTPPTVRIRIGRIEVRAEIVSPVPTSPTQRSQPSALSLDQFLKQVGGSAR
jgi:hypothetical protein